MVINTFLDKAYYVESDDETMLIAVKLRIGGDLMIWYDTVHDRTIKNPTVNILSDGKFTVTDKKSNTHKFIPMTRAVYRDKIKTRVSGMSFTDFRKKWDFELP